TGTALVDYGPCPADFAGYAVPRLAAFEQGQVEQGGFPNLVREAPSTSAREVFRMNPGAVFSLVEGPQCGNRIVWWLVEFNGQRGWTAESQAGSYYLRPVEGTQRGTSAAPGQVLGALAEGTNARISPANLPALTSLARIGLPSAANFSPHVAWAADGQRLFISQANGVQVHNLPALERDVRLTNALISAVVDPASGLSRVTSLVAHPEGSLIIGTGQGQLLVINPASASVSSIAESGHQAAITGLAISPAGNLLLSSDGTRVRLWDFATLNTNLGRMGALFDLNLEPGSVQTVQFTSGNLPALALRNEVRLYDVRGSLLRSHPRANAESLAALEPATEAWFPTVSGLLLVEDEAIYGYDVTAGLTFSPLVPRGAEPVRVLAQLLPGAAAEPPLLAVYRAVAGAPTGSLSWHAPALSAPAPSVPTLPVVQLAFSPEGRYLAAVTANEVVIYGIGAAGR
ncbi:MAG: hypothetical protein HC915_18045, partial [Anaerolineae bacterium]|nr:hypothetical protein [Anaerolineae bacterium]